MLFQTTERSVTITDINLGAYLMLRGARLQSVDEVAPRRKAFLFTHKRMRDILHDYEQHAEIRFSPKILFGFREQLKHLTFVPPQS